MWGLAYYWTTLYNISDHLVICEGWHITERPFTTFLIIQLYMRVGILLSDPLQHFWSSSYMWGLSYYWTILYNISDHPVICEGWHIAERSFTTFLSIQLYVRVGILLNDPLQHFWSSSYMWVLAYYCTILYNISDHPVICEGLHITERSFTTFLIIQLYLRVGILLTYGKRFHDRII
jgi:phage-related protein